MKVVIALFSYGGINGETVDCLVDEIAIAGARGVEIMYVRVGDDALISRSRSRIASKFLDDTDSDVLVMVDHDIAWQAGDLLDLAAVAVREQAVVAGLYACRALGAGVSSRLPNGTHVTIGEDRLIDADYVAAGFTAYPRAVLARVQAPEFGVRAESCRAYFMPMVVDGEYLSEDWAASSRVREASMRTLVWTKPVLRHFGLHGFTVTDGTAP